MIDKSATDKSISPPRAGRSPAYPAFGLAFALEKLQLFYKAQIKNSVSLEAATESLGYQTAKSGAAQRAIAALISYGLLSEEGGGTSRKVKITEMGRKILLLQENDSDRKDLIREAACSPKIYKDMLTQWPENLPSDKELNKYLTFTKNYHEDAVPSLIRAFRETYEFANLNNSEYHQAEAEEGMETNEAQNSQQKQNRIVPPDNRGIGVKTDAASENESAQRILHIPLTGGRVAVIQTPEAIDEADYEYIRRYLELFKDAIITKKIIRESPSQQSQPPEVKSGSAIWHTKEHDLPVIVTGYLGEQDGKHYASTEGSTSGVPLEEIRYN